MRRAVLAPLAAFVLAPALLAGCSLFGFPPSQQPERDEGAEPPGTVCALEDCPALMARARRWLVQTTSFNIMTETDTYIGTERDAVPTSQRIWGSVELRREDATHGRVILSLRCNNPFKCREDVRLLQRRAYEDLGKPAT
jgi:hypothetical protein